MAKRRKHGLGSRIATAWAAIHGCTVEEFAERANQLVQSGAFDQIMDDSKGVLTDVVDMARRGVQ